ncbi:PREDICTED: protein kinase C-binding protein 1-like [Priapulus caudatus]|uniref:Protein kinase C-binding protein 1-like n=1 Tax=Priapulus caudatus TaxID=37621 RepID=A0ABM1DX38_PRICU|nr:PREDICTED: protein kinase C-binding protein 1-like [Priapulus caudatus]
MAGKGVGQPALSLTTEEERESTSKSDLDQSQECLPTELGDHNSTTKVNQIDKLAESVSVTGETQGGTGCASIQSKVSERRTTVSLVPVQNVASPNKATGSPKLRACINTPNILAQKSKCLTASASRNDTLTTPVVESSAKSSPLKSGKAVTPSKKKLGLFRKAASSPLMTGSVDRPLAVRKSVRSTAGVNMNRPENSLVVTTRHKDGSLNVATRRRSSTGSAITPVRSPFTGKTPVKTLCSKAVVSVKKEAETTAPGPKTAMKLKESTVTTTSAMPAKSSPAPLTHAKTESSKKFAKKRVPNEDKFALPPPPKRRKRNDETEHENDYYCWVCHREGTVICCELCPRVFHTKCINLDAEPTGDWVCPECERIVVAECTDTQSAAMRMLTQDQRCVLFRHAVQRMKQSALEAFHQPVSTTQVPTYADYIIHPMDLSTLEKNVRRKMYGSLEALLADGKWILHNCIIFNGPHHKLTAAAKLIIKVAKHEMSEIDVCPDCYLNSCTKKENWFCEPCRNPHALVWAKLKGFPFWPAKALRVANGLVDVRFFGQHDRAWVPLSQCYQLSRDIPTPIAKKKKGGFSPSMDELELHLQCVRDRLGVFRYAKFRQLFDPTRMHIDGGAPAKVGEVTKVAAKVREVAEVTEVGETTPRKVKVKLVVSAAAVKAAGSPLKAARAALMRKYRTMGGGGRTATGGGAEDAGGVAVDDGEAEADAAGGGDGATPGGAGGETRESRTPDPEDPAKEQGSEEGARADEAPAAATKLRDASDDARTEEGAAIPRPSFSTAARCDGAVDKGVFTSSMEERVEPVRLKVPKLDKERLPKLDGSVIEKLAEKAGAGAPTDAPAPGETTDRIAVAAPPASIDLTEDQTLISRTKKEEEARAGKAEPKLSTSLEDDAKDSSVDDDEEEDSRLPDEKEEAEGPDAPGLSPDEKMAAAAKCASAPKLDEFSVKLSRTIEQCKANLGIEMAPLELSSSDDEEEEQEEEEETDSQISEAEKEGTSIEPSESCEPVAKKSRRTPPASRDTVDDRRSGDVLGSAERRGEGNAPNSTTEKASNDDPPRDGSQGMNPVVRDSRMPADGEAASTPTSDLRPLTPAVREDCGRSREEPIPIRGSPRGDGVVVTDPPMKTAVSAGMPSPGDVSATTDASIVAAMDVDDVSATTPADVDDVSAATGTDVRDVSMATPMDVEGISATTATDAGDVAATTDGSDMESEHELVIDLEGQNGKPTVAPAKHEEGSRDALANADIAGQDAAAAGVGRDALGSSPPAGVDRDTAGVARDAAVASPPAGVEQNEAGVERDAAASPLASRVASALATPKRARKSTSGSPRVVPGDVAAAASLESRRRQEEQWRQRQQQQQQQASPSSTTISPKQSSEVSQGRAMMTAVLMPATPTIEASNIRTPSPSVVTMQASQGHAKITATLLQASSPTSTLTPTASLPVQSQKYIDKLSVAMRGVVEEMYADMQQQQSVSRPPDFIQEANSKHQQELTEIRHNIELTLIEMRQSFEIEKKRALMMARKQVEEQQKARLKAKEMMWEREKTDIYREMQAAIAASKKKQWCANCCKEAIFYCCWNTSYCDYPCQQAHWPAHMSSCTQMGQQQQQHQQAVAAASDTSSGAECKVTSLNGSSVQGVQGEGVDTNKSLENLQATVEKLKPHEQQPHPVHIVANTSQTTPHHVSSPSQVMYGSGPTLHYVMPQPPISQFPPGYPGPPVHLGTAPHVLRTMAPPVGGPGILYPMLRPQQPGPPLPPGQIIVTSQPMARGMRQQMFQHTRF